MLVFHGDFFLRRSEFFGKGEWHVEKEKDGLRNGRGSEGKGILRIRARYSTEGLSGHSKKEGKVMMETAGSFLVEGRRAIACACY